MIKIKSLLCLAVLFQTTNIWAQSVKVGKIKGNRAIVEITEGQLESGQIYQIGLEGSGSSSKGKPSKRDNYVSGSLGFKSSTTKVGSSSANTSSINLEGSYGWNKVQFEFGPIFSYATVNDGTSTTTLWALGGEALYNLVPNKGNAEVLYGPGAKLYMGSGTLGSKSFGLYGVSIFGFWKYFPKSLNFGVATQLGYQLQTNNTDPASSSSGVNIQLQILNYF